MMPSLASFTPDELGSCSLLLTLTIEEARSLVVDLERAVAEAAPVGAHAQVTVLGELRVMKGGSDG